MPRSPIPPLIPPLRRNGGPYTFGRVSVGALSPLLGFSSRSQFYLIPPASDGAIDYRWPLATPHRSVVRSAARPVRNPDGSETAENRAHEENGDWFDQVTCTWRHEQDAPVAARAGWSQLRGEWREWAETWIGNTRKCRVCMRDIVRSTVAGGEFSNTYNFYGATSNGGFARPVDGAGTPVCSECAHEGSLRPCARCSTAMCHRGVSTRVTMAATNHDPHGLMLAEDVFVCGSCLRHVVPALIVSPLAVTVGMTERAALRAAVAREAVEGQADSDPYGDRLSTLADGVTRVTVPSGWIAGHGYKPRPYFRISTEEATRLALPPVYGAPQGEMPFFGFEIETEAPRTLSGGQVQNAARDFWEDRTGAYFVKGDSSITYGFEVVSQPGSLEYWRNHAFASFKAAAARGFCSYRTTTCGMHVHVSRDVLSPLSITKMLFFMRENQPFILHVSRRRPESLERWAAPDCDNTRTLILKARDPRGGWNRYTALNCTNDRTVEFRLFRGTLHGPAILRNIEFVQALISFADDNPLRRMTAKAFIEWLATTTTVPTPARKSLLSWLKPLVRVNSRREISGRLTLRDDSSVVRLPMLNTDTPSPMENEEGIAPSTTAAVTLLTDHDEAPDQPEEDYNVDSDDSDVEEDSG